MTCIISLLLVSYLLISQYSNFVTVPIILQKFFTPEHHCLITYNLYPVHTFIIIVIQDDGLAIDFPVHNAYTADLIHGVIDPFHQKHVIPVCAYTDEGIISARVTRYQFCFYRLRTDILDQINIPALLLDEQARLRIPDRTGGVFEYSGSASTVAVAGRSSQL